MLNQQTEHSDESHVRASRPSSDVHYRSQSGYLRHSTVRQGSRAMNAHRCVAPSSGMSRSQELTTEELDQLYRPFTHGSNSGLAMQFLEQAADGLAGVEDCDLQSSVSPTMHMTWEFLSIRGKHTMIQCALVQPVVSSATITFNMFPGQSVIDSAVAEVHKHFPGFKAGRSASKQVLGVKALDIAEDVVKQGIGPRAGFSVTSINLSHE